MIDAVVKQLKTGTWKNVVPYPYDEQPSAPYIVVKEEPVPSLGRTVYRVIVHGKPGQLLDVRAYARKDLFVLLANKRLTSLNGTENVVLSSDELEGLSAQNDDGTVSDGRLFFVNDLF